jgi:hypothetical protein
MIRVCNCIVFAETGLDLRLAIPSDRAMSFYGKAAHRWSQDVHAPPSKMKTNAAKSDKMPLACFQNRSNHQ